MKVSTECAQRAKIAMRGFKAELKWKTELIEVCRVWILELVCPVQSIPLSHERDACSPENNL